MALATKEDLQTDLRGVELRLTLAIERAANEMTIHIVGMLASFMATIAILIAAAISTASAGTCRIYGEGAYMVEACDNGSFETWDSHHGRRRVYGDPNGGFDKYPGQDGPVFERRDKEYKLCPRN